MKANENFLRGPFKMKKKAFIALITLFGALFALLLSDAFYNKIYAKEKTAAQGGRQMILVCPECPPCPPCDCAKQEGEKKEKIENKSETAAQMPDYIPDISHLSHIEDMYEPVSFGHQMHTEIVENCQKCHHHHTEVERVPPCRECHQLSGKTLNKPGLKGAYHRQCMNCHREIGSGPLDCDGCHRKKEKPGKPKIEKPYAPKQAILGHISKEYKPVTFNHELHVETTDSCNDCHHHHTDIERTPPCRECHSTATSKTGKKEPGLKEIYHEQCLNCHRGEGAGPLGCADCHQKK
ncbi:MAG: hypothetical protein Kow0090_14430 [Myxococcota bacterium]